jgi:hypothetical protein
LVPLRGGPRFFLGGAIPIKKNSVSAQIADERVQIPGQFLIR